MYVRIGYSNSPVDPGFRAKQGGKMKDLVRVPAARYVDAIFVEVVPATSNRNDIGVTRTQAAIRLYASIFNSPEVPKARLYVSA